MRQPEEWPQYPGPEEERPHAVPGFGPDDGGARRRRSKPWLLIAGCILMLAALTVAGLMLLRGPVSPEYLMMLLMVPAVLVIFGIKRLNSRG